MQLQIASFKNVHNKSVCVCEKKNQQLLWIEFSLTLSELPVNIMAPLKGPFKGLECTHISNDADPS